MRFILFSIFLLHFSSNCNSFVNSDLANVLKLTSNFFGNLNSLGGTQDFIDNQINHYTNLIKRTHGLIPKSKSKRSILNDDIEVLTTDFIGVYVLNGFFEQTRIPVINPIDISLFKHDFGGTEIYYAAVLQNNNIKYEEADMLIIYRIEDDNYIKISNVSVSKATKIETYAFHGIIYIIITDFFFNSRLSVYQFDINENLYNTQIINDVNPSDIAIWQQYNQIFLAVTQQQINETESVIFMLVDKIFKYFQHINTKGAKKVTHFQIDNEQYLIVANHIDDKEETEIYSEIFKYDNQIGRFGPHQKILTYAAVDVKYFCFTQNGVHESFIVVANSYEIDSEDKVNYETNSIIYKYVDDYFLPFQSLTLNYAERWLPVIGPNGEFILLVSLKYDGVKIFQYDGWKFIESGVQYTGEAFGPGVRSFRSYLYDSQPIIVVANKNDYGDLLNVFSPVFVYQNVMNEFQMDTFDWCQQLTKELEMEDLKELSWLVKEAPKVDDFEIELHGKLLFDNVTIYNLVVEDVNANRKEEYVEFTDLERQIDKRSEQVKELDSNLFNNEPVVFNGNVKIKNLEISDDRIIFDDLYVKNINDINMEEFFEDIINIEDEFIISDNMYFENIIFDGPISAEYLNNIPKSALIYKHSDLIINQDLIVDGNVIIDDLIVDGYLDGVKFNEKNILLTENDQILEGNISFDEIMAENVQINYLNDIDLMNMEPNKIINVAEHKITTLRVKNVTVHTINGMGMNIFHDLVLRTRGDQQIISNYEFETLIVDEIIVDGLFSGTNISHLALISGTTNLILQPVYFTDLIADNLHVIQSLNQIPVYNGKLDVLLKNYHKVQYIEGHKTFENINLSGPIELRGRIDIKGLKPPIITRNVTVTGDFVINGDVDVSKLLKFGDLAELEGIYSFERLTKQGLKLTDSEIPNHLIFNQDLNVDRIEVDTINDVDVNTWFVFEDDIPKITGTKIFDGNLNINGELNIKSINGINLDELYNNILRIDGDQIITGKHTYSNINSIRVVGNKTTLNNVLWDNIMTIEGDQFIAGTTIFSNPIKVDQFEANSARIGTIQDINFNDLIADTAFNDTLNIVTAKKTFESDLFIENMEADFINNADLHKFLNEINQWFGDVHLNGTIDIEELEADGVYTEKLNGIGRKDFGNIWLVKNGAQTIFEEQHFGNLHCKNINSELINDLDLLDFFSNVVRTNEDHKFDFVHFINGIESKHNVEINGKINNFNISDAILRKSPNKQTITALKSVSNLTIDGSLHVNGLLSGINLTILQKLTSKNDQQNIKLIIDGNINFKHKFDVNHLNSINIQEIAKKAWYTNEPTNIRGATFFENVVFKKDLQVDGLVNGLPLVWLSKNYFSKTKNQNISAHLNFVDGVVFSKNIEAKKALVSGLVANISLQEFNKNILRIDDQIFDFEIEFDDVEVTGEFNAKSINKLDLSTDVMRNDVKENYVTGNKVIKNINARTLDVAKGKKIQNVDVDDWFQNSVLSNGTFKIDGLTTIKSAKFEQNIDLQGLLNSHIFDEKHILTTNTKQKITGRKKFITTGKLFNSSLIFDNLFVKGLYNDINIQELFDLQIDKSKEVQISAVKNFRNTLKASEVIFDGLYQGININELIKNATDLENFNNYKDEYKKLTEFARKTLVVLDQQSHYLNTFQQIQKLDLSLQEILVMQNYEKPFVALATQNNTSVNVLLFEWDKIAKQFIQAGDMSIETKSGITFMSQTTFNNKLYLYLEQLNMKSDLSHLGTMYEISITKKDINLFYTETNKTNYLTGFTTPNNCLLIIQADNIANILCNKNKNIFELQQQIILENGAIAASVITIKNIPYICLLDNSIYPTLKILKYSTKNSSFNWHQILAILQPSSIDSIRYNNKYYLAVSIRHNIESGDPGHIIIYRYEETNDKFAEWQTISIIDPIKVKFAILSSDELILQALSTCPAQPLIMYLYAGVSKFINKFTASTLPIVSIVNNFVADNTDFIHVSNGKEVRIFKAVYNGKKYY